MFLTYQAEAKSMRVKAANYGLGCFHFGAIDQTNTFSLAIFYNNFVNFAISEELPTILNNYPDGGMS
ncbi:hypothetical protein ES703_108192 [subsurface metagenome]